MGIIKSISRGVAKAATVVKGIQKSVATTAIKTVATAGSKVIPKGSKLTTYGKSANLTKAVSSIGLYSAVAAPAYQLSKKIPGVGVGWQVEQIKKAVKSKSQPKRPMGVINKDINTVATVAKAGGSMGLLGKAGKYAAGAALIGGGLYATEQVAEKLGVRGGAGFIGSRPMGMRTHRRRGIISKRAMKNIRRVNSYKKQVKKAARVLGLFKARPVSKGGKK